MVTALCTSCGHVWEAPTAPADCPACAFRGLVVMPSASPAATALRKRAEQEEEPW